MKDVTIPEYKAKCSTMLKQVCKTKKPIRITRFGKPVAEVVPPTSVTGKGDWLGSMAGTMEIVGDVVSPVIEAAWTSVSRRRTGPSG